MKKRILFVDDDVHVLRGLERGLRAMRSEWDMEFAPGGGDAIRAMGAGGLDAVVTDMRMPEIDGLQVLEEAVRKHPGTLRAVLSGQAEPEALLRAAPSTHFIFMKPCDTGLIRERLKDVLDRRQGLDGDWAQSVVASVAAVPSAPALFAEVLAELWAAAPSIERIGQLVAMDMGMSATVLHFVNSGYFGPRNATLSPERAVETLGLDSLRGLLAADRAGPAMKNADFEHFDPAAVWQESVTVSTRARALAQAHSRDAALSEEAFAAGLFRDVGQLVLAHALGCLYDSVVERAVGAGQPLRMAEESLLGMSHGEVGARLLDLWGMPEGVVDAVRWHDCPSNGKNREFSALTAVHLAEGIEPLDRRGVIAGKHDLDHGYLKALGLDLLFPVH